MVELGGGLTPEELLATPDSDRDLFPFGALPLVEAGAACDVGRCASATSGVFPRRGSHQQLGISYIKRSYQLLLLVFGYFSWLLGKRFLLFIYLGRSQFGNNTEHSRYQQHSPIITHSPLSHYHSFIIMSDTRDKNLKAATESMKGHREAILGGSPEDKVKAWLQLTKDESGHLKAGVSNDLHLIEYIF